MNDRLELKKFDMTSVPRTSLIGVVASRGAGKCLAEGTTVLTFDGKVKKVEKITKRDVLIGPDNAPRYIRSLCTGKSVMYNVTDDIGNKYTVNDSHILTVMLNTARYWTRGSTCTTVHSFEYDDTGRPQLKVRSASFRQVVHAIRYLYSIPEYQKNR